MYANHAKIGFAKMLFKILFKQQIENKNGYWMVRVVLMAMTGYAYPVI